MPHIPASDFTTRTVSCDKNIKISASCLVFVGHWNWPRALRKQTSFACLVAINSET